MHQDAQPPVDVETGRVRGIYDAMAPRYDRMIAVAERLLFRDGRQWACAQATERVLEVRRRHRPQPGLLPRPTSTSPVSSSAPACWPKAQAPAPGRCAGRSTCDSVTPST